jgi:dipeptidyl aminopeptidase/acylaminoacyl peptidase
MRLSPHGDLLAYTVDGEIWLVATQKGSRPEKVAKGALPLWSPDGERLAFYSEASGTFQLWVLELKSLRSEQLTHFERGIDPDPATRLFGFGSDALRYGWSPDSRKLVFTSQVPTPDGNSNQIQHPRMIRAPTNKGLGPLVLTTTTPPDWTLSGIFSHAFRSNPWASWEKSHSTKHDDHPFAVRRVNQLFIVDTKGKKVEQLTHDNAVYFNPDWSPDGKKIVCASSEGQSLHNFGTGTTNLYVIEIATRKKSAITFGAGEKRMPSWSPDGESIAYLGGEHFGIQSVFVMPTSGGIPTNIASPLDRFVDGFQWDYDGTSIVVWYVDGVSRRISRVSIGADHVEPIGGEEALTRQNITLARTGAIAWQQSNASTYGIVSVLHPTSSLPDVLLDLNPQINDWELGNQEVVQWTNHRGDEMDGILIMPAGFTPGHKYPLIVDCYPMQGNWFMGATMMGNQALVSRGYAVFYPNARAPHVWMNPFKSKDYNQAARGPKGWDVTVEDILSGVDELVHRGIIDPDRLGLYGFSNGGAVVDYLVTHTNRFKCAVSVAAAYPDWLLPFFLRTDSAVPTWEGGVDPLEDPKAYIELSAVFSLRGVSTPMLLADGDDDGFFLLGTIEMYNALRWLGKDVIFLRYPGQEHGFSGAALIDFWLRMNDFFDRNLGSTRFTN